MLTQKFKHSGTLGDIVYALAVMKYLGGGEFYLHMNNINNIGMKYYGRMPAPFHQGRMNNQDFEFMRSFFESQSYITKFSRYDDSVDLSHDLDDFRPAFVHHPGNYVDIYCKAFGITDPDIQKQIRTSPWLTVPEPKTFPGKQYVINRTARWIPGNHNTSWDRLAENGVADQAVFVGLPEEHAEFESKLNWKIDYHPVKDMLELASVIAGAKMFIGNQSVALSIAIGLGVAYGCEARRDLPDSRNECYFPDQPNSLYF
jgi:hypothetical protein